MKINTIDNFDIGDRVYHRSNTYLYMVVIEIHRDSQEISCRWLDKLGVTHVERFLPQELVKANNSGLAVGFF